MFLLYKINISSPINNYSVLFLLLFKTLTYYFFVPFPSFYWAANNRNAFWK